MTTGENYTMLTTKLRIKKKDVAYVFFERFVYHSNVSIFY